MGEIVLKCKDFDAWVSFLRRLNKVGSGYIIKNDIILATIKGKKSSKKSGSADTIPGRHIIKDPLFIPDEDSYVTDGVYGLYDDLNKWINLFDNIKDRSADARKKIIYTRRRDGIYIQFYGGLEFKMFGLITDENLNSEEFKSIRQSASGIHWFENFIETPKMIESNWIPINTDTLIAIRNGTPITLKQIVNDKPMWARIAKSVFIMANTPRLGAPIAEKAEYSIIPPPANATQPIGMLEIAASYKGAKNSEMISISCIHEYLILIYKEEEE